MNETFNNSICPVESKTYFKDFGDQGFLLENGKTLPALEICYETYGKLNDERNNVIWVCSPLTADAHVAGLYSKEDKKPGWWDALIGPGKAIDTEKFFVVCSNILGGCKGSTGPASINPRTQKPYGSTFPTITIGDMVHAQMELFKGLNLKSVHCVIGGSMGGFQAMKWAIYYPDLVKQCVIIATSPRFSSQALGFEIVARDIITQDPHFNNGDYYEQSSKPDIGLANARKLAHITYLSAVGMEKKFKRAQDHENKNHKITYSTPFDLELPLESYLRYQGSKFVDRFDANSYLHIAHATDCFDLETEYGSLENAFKDIKAEVLNVNLSTDWLFPPHESRRITSALLNCGKSVTSLEMDTQFGHDGFLIEVGELGRAVGRFLDSKNLSQADGTKSIPAFHNPADFELISSLVDDGSRILDLGGGGGELFDYLRQAKKTTGFGIEKNIKDILTCIENDVPVVQRDLDERGISDIGTGSFDYAIINRTIQEIRDPIALLNEVLRVAKRAIVSFPNFGHWSARGSLMLRGRMPKSKELPYEWYETPNIRILTIKDFYTLCKKEGLVLESLKIQNEQFASKILTALGLKNFGAEHVIATVSKKS